ncbi:hypothetical protein [Aggregatibacter actinomycetemcomitans]|nr:hypothetical protein [Aggregatibacter actinomycetemcomitans]
MLKQHHTIAQVSKMMSVSTSALQRGTVQYPEDNKVCRQTNRALF